MGNFTEDYVLGLDLGGDTVKLTFAYEDHYGKNVFGKIDSGGNDSVLNVAIPAIAYYDEEKNKWYYCNEVDTCEASSYSTIVKIKTLLSLLKYDKKKMSVSEENAGYYRNSYYFPKFYFPRAKRDLKNYKKDIAEERVFLSNKKIVEVCEGFFVYLKKFTEKRMDIYGKKFGYQFKLKDVGITYPFGAGQEYIDELARLVKFGFGILPAKKLNSTKALGWLAFYLKKAEQDEKLLVFDMGEESISVSKAFFVKDGSRKKHIAVDGVDAHNDALELGGLEVDEAIAAYLENKIGQREVFGMPHYGEEGYIKEKGVYENEYILLKNIKKAKVLLGSDYADDEFFKDGVPIEIIRDFYLQLRLTKEEMKNCVWEKGSNNSIYSKICDYVKKEADRSPTNNDVHKIIVTGGLSESYYLLDYLRAEMRKKNVEVLSFDYGKTNEDADSFEIMKYEDSVYAASLGAAIVTLENYSVKTVLSYS